MSRREGWYESMLGRDRDGPADWFDVSTLEGRRVGAFLEACSVESFVERFPGPVFRVVAWEAGRVGGRYLVRGTWTRRVQWAVEPRR